MPQSGAISFLKSAFDIKEKNRGKDANKDAMLAQNFNICLSVCRDTLKVVILCVLWSLNKRCILSPPVCLIY